MDWAEALRKCVAFIGCPIVGGEFRIAGSVFFYGKAGPDNQTNPTFLVTAEHVIRGMREKGAVKVAVRFNTRRGTMKYHVSDIDDWFKHPTDTSVDLAILECGVPLVADHLVIPSDLRVTPAPAEQSTLELGSAVLVAGLFVQHSGSERNIPIVRVGSLACLTEEKVDLNVYGNSDAYLVEMHSTGGISGSPVLVKERPAGLVVGNAHRYYFLGVMHGHFEAEVYAVGKQKFEPDEKIAMIHTGIAIVTPGEKLEELVELYIANPKTRGPIHFTVSLEEHAPDA